MGALSSKYESGGNPGTIANNPGDIGGKSYGTYQIIKSNVPSFLNYLKTADKEAFNNFAGKTVGGTTFDNAWKTYAANNPDKFEQLQHDYIESTHYKPALSKVEKSTGLDVSSRSKALQDVLWSTSVQHGSGGAANIFKNAGITENMSDMQIIQRIYAERSADNGKRYFSSSSDSVRQSVVNRFKSELIDALRMLQG